MTTRAGLGALVREPLLLIELPILICCMWAFGLYRPQRDRAILVESLQLLKASLASVVGLTLICLKVCAGCCRVGGVAGECGGAHSFVQTRPIK